MHSQTRESHSTKPDLNSQLEKNISRDFKGIWIPREIWLREDLKPLEKLLWAEIHSLYQRDKGGCYATNEYLAIFLGVTDRYIRDMINHLKTLGFVQEVSFNGRQRVIKAILPAEDFGNAISGQSGTAVPGREEPQFRSDRNPSSAPHYIENKEEGIDKNTQATNVAFECFGSHVKLKKEDYEKLVADSGKQAIDMLILEMNDYCKASKPKGYLDYAAAIRQWLRKRKISPQNKASYETPKDSARKRQNADWIETNGNPNDNPNIMRF
jgi:Helix-turn-helix domain